MGFSVIRMSVRAASSGHRLNTTRAARSRRGFSSYRRARQREQMAAEYAYHLQQQQMSQAQRASHATAMGIPCGPDGQPVGGGAPA